MLSVHLTYCTYNRKRETIGYKGIFIRAYTVQYSSACNKLFFSKTKTINTCDMKILYKRDGVYECGWYI